MSTIYQNMKKARMDAMREKQTFTKNTLTTIIGDIENEKLRGNEPTDESVTKLIQKYIKNAKENYNRTQKQEFMDEESLLTAFLPKQMSKEEIEEILFKGKESGDFNHIGDFMKYMKTNHMGEYDPKVASQLAKDNL